MRFKSIMIVGVLFLSACAGKNVAMKNASIRTVQKLRMGLVELSSHEFNIPSFYDCMKNYPANTLLLDGQTRQELETVNWHSDNLIASLQTQNFETYENIKNFSLVFLIFRNKEQKSFVRVINFLSKQVRTISLSSDQFTCENVLAASNALVVDSIPPYADVFLNDRKIGEAPVWTSLSPGTYEIQCKLPDDVFPKKSVKIPGAAQHLCKRGNQSVQSLENNGDDSASFSEKSQSFFLYGLAGIASVAGAIIPYLLLK